MVLFNIQRYLILSFFIFFYRFFLVSIKQADFIE